MRPLILLPLSTEEVRSLKVLVRSEPSEIPFRTLSQPSCCFLFLGPTYSSQVSISSVDDDIG